MNVQNAYCDLMVGSSRRLSLVFILLIPSIFRSSQKMKFSLLSLAIGLFLIRDHVSCQSGVINRFYAQSGNQEAIAEGDDVILSCQADLDFDDATDTLNINYVTSAGETTKLATEADASDETNSVQWKNNVLIVYIDDVSRHDRGEYQCFAGRLVESTGYFEIIGQRLITVNVLYPSSGPPVCETSPINDDAIWYDGDEITLRCTSDAGNPEVILTWNNNKGVAITDAYIQVVSTDSLESYIVVTLDSIHDGVMFTCFRDNPIFPSNQQFCTIGPLTVEKERPTTLPSAESWTTVAMTMESKTATSTDGIGVIVAIVVVFIIVIGIVIITVFVVVKSGRCTSITKSNKDDSRTENVSLEAGHNNGKIVVEDHSHDNPAVDANHVLSPNGGQLYAVVQKNTPARESSTSGDTSIVYPTAPAYPRPEKTRQSDCDLYANARILRDDEASGESPDNPSSNSAEDRAGIPFDKSNDGDASGMALYANPSDVVTGDSADASLVGTTTKQEDPEMGLYANASEVIPDDSHMPAPSEAPPAPPAMAHTPGIEYADIDVARPASLGADGRFDIISNEDQVLYASVK